MSESPRNGAKKRANPLFHFGSGLFSGVSSAVILQPADLLKTRVQQSHSASLRSTIRSILSSPHPIASLWRGTVPSALRTGFGSAVYFTTLNTLRLNVAARKQYAAGDTGSLSVLPGSSSVLPRLSSSENLTTGAFARVLAGFILMPMTVLKVRFESDFYNYKSLWSASKEIYSQNGTKGFFTGFGATAIRDAPYAGLYVVFYELSKSRLSNTGTRAVDMTASSAATINFTSGAVAAAVATTMTNPFDAIKTRIQLLPGKYGNMFRTLKIMLREDGFRSLFDGLTLRMARKGASSALAWTVYEELVGRAERRLITSDKDAKEKAGEPL